MYKITVEEGYYGDSETNTEIYGTKEGVKNRFNELIANFKEGITKEDNFKKIKLGKNHIRWEDGGFYSDQFFDIKAEEIQVEDQKEPAHCNDTKIKVYYVLEDWSVEFDCTESPQVTIYKTLEDATKAYEQKVADAKNDSTAWGNETEENDLNPEDRCFSVSESGRWSENHIEVRLHYQEI